jgi:AraC family transcriptional regulator
MQQAIAYMEAHLREEIRVEDLADAARMSPYYFQRAFQVITGYSWMEYVRDRRLYLAALTVLSGQSRIIDVAYRYGYSTPDSFTKAFSRFHGLSPVQLREHPDKLRVFLPLKISITIQGGDDMDYVVEKMAAFRLIGFSENVAMASAYQDIPVFWDAFCKKYGSLLSLAAKPQNETERLIAAHTIGEYGVCLDDLPDKGQFRYLIAGRCPEEAAEVKGLHSIAFPAMEWAKFRAAGPLPAAIQTLNTRIFREWMPNHPAYEISMAASIEWYGRGNVRDEAYSSEIWIPVRRREGEMR